LIGQISSVKQNVPFISALMLFSYKVQSSKLICVLWSHPAFPFSCDAQKITGDKTLHTQNCVHRNNLIHSLWFVAI